MQNENLPNKEKLEDKAIEEIQENPSSENNQKNTNQEKPKKNSHFLDSVHKVAESFNNATTAVQSLIIIVGVLFLAFNAYGFYKAINNGVKEETKISATLVGNYVKKSQEIVSYKYFYTNAAMFENKKNIYGFDLPLTSKKFRGCTR